MLDKTTAKQTNVLISPPNFQVAKIKIVGTSPYVMNKMSSENRRKMMDKQEAGERSKKGEKRKPKDFDGNVSLDAPIPYGYGPRPGVVT
jgi:hypothetical protein